MTALPWPPLYRSTQTQTRYLIVDGRDPIGAIHGDCTLARTARRRRDRLDNAYGGYRYRVVAVQVPANGYTKADLRQALQNGSAVL